MAQLSRAAVERVYDVIDTRPEVADPAHAMPLPDGPLGVRLGTYVRLRLGPPGARRPRSGPRPRRDGGAGRPRRIGQDRALAAAPPLLRPDRGVRRADRRDGERVDVADVAARDLRGAIGLVFDEPFLFSDTIAANIALGSARRQRRGDPRAPRNSPPPTSSSRRCPTATTPWSASAGSPSPAGSDSGSRWHARCWSTRGCSSSTTPPPPSTPPPRPRSSTPCPRGPHRGRTTLILAHRRSTLALADRVAVLDRGRIIDIGTVAELDERCPLFRALLAGPDPERAHPTDAASRTEPRADPTSRMPCPRPCRGPMNADGPTSRRVGGPARRRPAR